MVYGFSLVFGVIKVINLFAISRVFSETDSIIGNPLLITGIIVRKDTREYRTRKPQYSPYYRYIEDNYEIFEQVYERKYEPKYGYLRPIVSKVIWSLHRICYTPDYKSHQLILTKLIWCPVFGVHIRSITFLYNFPISSLVIHLIIKNPSLIDSINNLGP